jgi:hypothetical protein
MPWVLAELGHSQIQNRPLRNAEFIGSGRFANPCQNRAAQPLGTTSRRPQLAPELGPFLRPLGGKLGHFGCDKYAPRVALTEGQSIRATERIPALGGLPQETERPRLRGASGAADGWQT